MNEALHIEARRYVEVRREAGAIFDKKMLRFNDIVTVGGHYSACCVVPSLSVAMAGVREAVDACVKEYRSSPEFIGPGMCDPQYVPGRDPLTMIQPWMEAGNA